MRRIKTRQDYRLKKGRIEMERAFDLFVDNVNYGRVWLTLSDLADLEPIGRAVSGLMRYSAKNNPKAIYRDTLQER